MILRALLAGAAFLALVAPTAGAPPQEAAAGATDVAEQEQRTPPEPSLREALDAYLDKRWLPEAEKATQELLARVREAKLNEDDVERMLRSGRSHYERAKTQGKLVLIRNLQCEHVDYVTSFLLYVPKSYDPAKAAPLLLVGHGGNSAMSADYAVRASLSGMLPWLPAVEKDAFILAAPQSERGWGPIGNSILLSLISRLQRPLNIDPDRIYITGHSMGGHLSWRSGIYLADRWGAVAPMSGGYDYVENKQVYPLVNVPGYATYGKQEPYNINEFNNKIKAWMANHDYDWRFVEKPGRHQIFADELPKILRFFRAHPRNLYRRRVYGTAGSSVVYKAASKNEKWPGPHTWNPHRPISRSTFHWIRLYPLSDDVAKEKAVRRVLAENLGQNRFKIVSQNVRRLRLYLHPRMVDFTQPIEVVANGKTVFKGKVSPRMKTMLELVREFDDRGRIFHAAVEIEIPTDSQVPEPRGGKTGSQCHGARQGEGVVAGKR